MNFEPVSVFDIGARGGLHRSWVNFPLPLIYSAFEPDIDEYNRLSAESASASNNSEIKNIFHVFNYALGKSTGSFPLNIYSHRPGCSFFQHTPNESYRFKNCNYVGSVDVKTISLDDFIAKHSLTPKFISMDIEGSELDVLSSCHQSTLQRILGIRCEVMMSPIYKDAPSFADVVLFLRSEGFRLCRIESCNCGFAGITTDMNDYSVSPFDALPFAADMIFVNEKYILNALASGDNSIDLVLSLLFLLHNGAGYKAMDYLELFVASPFWSSFSRENPAYLHQLCCNVATYLLLPRKGNNCFLNSAKVFKDLFKDDIQNYFDVASKLTTKFSTVYDDDLLYGRLVRPEGQYDTTPYAELV